MERKKNVIYWIGLIGGFMSGFFGGGGGLLFHPAFTRILKLKEYEARGTTLITIFPAVLVASIFYAGNHFVDMELAIKVMLGGAVGGILGAKWMPKIPSFYLSITFAIFLVVTAIKMII